MGMNMLIAQLACSYGSTYQDMVGFARLRRIKLIVETMPSVSAKNWAGFLNGLKLDQRLEFNEGDVGLAGGIQVSEVASAHPTTVDMIKRFGGSTSPAMQWPEEDGAGDDDTDKFDRLEERAVNAAITNAKQVIENAEKAPEGQLKAMADSLTRIKTKLVEAFTCTSEDTPTDD